MDTTPADGPLGGYRILDLTTVIMGPFATRILADLGADVIKVEPSEGDSFRRYHPQRGPGMFGSVLNLHRNKRAIVLDLKRPACRQALDRLVGTADVFLHNLRPAVVARAGYGYGRVRALKPDIVYCAACGFGSDGPYAERPAYDDLIQAGSGLAALSGAVRGEPAYVPSVVCDKLAGQAIAYAVLAALLHRERGGGGQAVEVPMLEAAVEFNLMEHMAGAAFEPPMGPAGFARMMSPARKPFRTADGHACILPYSDRNWLQFYDFTGRSECRDDPRYRTIADRVRNIGALYAVVEEEAAKRTTAEWVAFCARADIPCMPVASLDDLPDDPHLRAVGMFGTADHPTEGPYRTVRPAVRLGATPHRLRRHAPRLGEHTEEVLREAGLTEAQVAAVLGPSAAGRAAAPGGAIGSD